MKVFLMSTLMLTAVISSAQSERKFIRKGNHDYKKNDFVESEIQYRNALEQNSHSFKGQFNLADALYKQNKFNESLETLNNLNLTGLSNDQKASVLHNKGNALFKQNKLKESIEAYKSALKFNPNDKETKYNLSEAIRLFQQQQQNQQDNNNKDKDKDKDKQNQNQNQPDNPKDEQNNNPDNRDSQGNNQQQPKLSKEDAERILEAIQNHEMQIQDRLKEEKAKQAKVRVGKNW